MKAFFLAILVSFIFVGPGPLRAQDQAPQEAPSHVGESCASVQNQRRETCKKSAKTCSEVHRIGALNLIKNCAVLARNCDSLGAQEDEICQPGGNGRITFKPPSPSR